MARGSDVYAMDIKALRIKSREKLIRQFLPDIERHQAKLGYVYKVRPFNYNLEHFNTVELRRPAVAARPQHDTQVVMKCGYKAANEIEPRPLWVVKPLQATEKSYVNPNEEYALFTRYYTWRYRKKVLNNGQYSLNARSIVGDVRMPEGMSQECGVTKSLWRTPRVQTS